MENPTTNLSETAQKITIVHATECQQWDTHIKNRIMQTITWPSSIYSSCFLMEPSPCLHKTLQILLCILSCYPAKKELLDKLCSREYFRLLVTN